MAEDDFCPKGIWIQTINKCNFRCAICPYPGINKEKGTGAMDDGLFHKIISQANNFPSIKWLSFSMQNEPFLDRNIYEKIAYAKSKSGFAICATTNGYFLTPRNIAKLINTGIDKVIVSLNAFSKETYAKITGVNCYNAVLRNINALLRVKPKEMEFVLSFVITKDNTSENGPFKSYWKSRNIQTRVFYANNRAGFFKNHPPADITKRCKALFEEINIRYNGDVALCRQDWRNSIILGNLCHNSVEEIWSGEKARKLRKKFSKYIYNSPPCSECNGPC